jgi:sugar phosphate isomerase/epimerase
MTRKTLYILALILFTGCVNSKIATNPKSDKEIYLQLYSVRKDIKEDFAKTITEISKIGYYGIEAAGYADGKFYNLSPTEFKNEIEKVGLKVLSSHIKFPLAQNTAETNWENVWKWWEQAIQAHKEAGMKYIVIPSIPKPTNLYDLKTYCDYFNQIGEKCNKAGLKLGYHNHSFEFSEIDGTILYDFMLENTDSTKVFFQMDVYWTVYGNKSPVEYFQKYPGRFEILHLKDYKELGESGMVGFDAILKNSHLAGTKHFIVEVEKYNYEPLESIKRSFEFLKNYPFY